LGIGESVESSCAQLNGTTQCGLLQGFLAQKQRYASLTQSRHQ